ncbi:MAG: hypothetical protein AAFP87_20510 [Pseudomonadota bacterium]
MAIITPQARTPFQQTRQPRRSFEEPDIGRAVGQIADIAVQYGVDQKEHERSMQMQTARVTATERLGALRDQYERDPNLDGLSGRFEQDAAAIGQDIVEQLPPGRLREQFELDYRRMAGPQGRAIARREYALQRDAALATLNGSLRTYEQQAAAAPDPKSRNAILQTAAADIGAAKAAGWITAQQEESLIAGTFGQAIATSALQSLQSDPQEFLDRLEAGEFDGLDPKQTVTLKGQAERAVLAQQARDVRAEQAAAKQRDAELKVQVDDAVDIIEGGLRYDDLAGLMDQVQGTPHEATLRATVAAAQTEDNFAIIDPVDQLAVIRQVEDTLTGDPEDVARLNRLRAMRQKTIDSLEADPLKHVSDRGILDVGAVTLDNRASIRKRIATAETVVEEVKVESPQLRYFTNGERDAIRAEIERGDPDAQLGIATQLVSAFGDRAPAVLEEVGASDPIFHLAGQLVDQTSDITAARTMLVGRQLARDKTGAKIKADVRRALVAEYTAVFPQADRQRLTALFEAADAHFASAGLSVDPDLDDAALKSAYRQSVQAVSGAVQHRGAAFGGIQPVRDRPTLLPPNLSADVVEETLERATDDAWLGASLTGGAPTIGGKALPELGSRQARRARLSQMQLMSVGGGAYLVGLPRSDGSMRWLMDDQAADGLYRVDLVALQRAVMEGLE